MAFMMDHQRSSFKHFCKICKKGFMCGRALGGHMRAHGIGDETIHMEEEEDVVSDWEDNKNDEHSQSGSRRLYALRANPNRLKTCRICQNCGKEFLSWKLFLEHGKCGLDDAEFSSHESEEEDGLAHKGCGWSKRKRSLRVDVDNEDEDLANCLVMLSNARVDPSGTEPEESCTSANRDDERRKSSNFVAVNTDKAKGVARGLFECKACKKVFNSHQALGGHRASHKKVKGCFAARLDQVDDYVPEDEGISMHEDFFPTMQKPASNNQLLQHDHGSSYAQTINAKRKSKVHECSICHRVFSSGQALGGHKRCHWITSNSPDTASLVKLQQFHDHLEQLQQNQTSNIKFVGPDPLDLKLDLNTPVPLSSESITLWFRTNSNEREVPYDQPIQIDKNQSIKKNKDSKNVYVENIKEMNYVEDGDSKVKLAKLNKLKDMNLLEEGSSSWLQVGIGTTPTDQQCHTTTSK